MPIAFRWRTGLLPGLVLAALCAPVAPARAQDFDEPPPEAETLRRRIEDRFAEQVKANLGLTDAQAARLRESAGRWAATRRGMEMEERQLKRSLQGQLRPGVAADADSVARVTQRLMDLKVAYAQTYRDELRDWDFLSPVQRAQLVVMRERLFTVLRTAREERLRGGAGPGPGAGLRRPGRTP